MESSEGERKFTSAVMAPLAVVALAGIILGAGRGSVYGTRRRGARGIAQSRKSLLLLGLLSFNHRWSSRAKFGRRSLHVGAPLRPVVMS